MPEPTLEELRDKVGDAWHRQAWDELINLYTQIIKLAPDGYADHFHRGIICRQEGDLNRSIDDFNQVITLKPDYAEAYLERGAAYAERGELDLALKDLDKAIELESNFADAYFKRGIVHRLKGNLALSTENFDQAIVLNPDNAETYLNRGITHTQAGEHISAMDDYNKAIELNQNFDNAYYARALAYETKGEIDDALEDYNKAIELNSEMLTAHLSRGSIHSYKGNFAQAIKDYNREIELDPNSPGAYFGLGCTYMQERDYHNAFKCFDKAFDLDSNGRLSAYESFYAFFIKNSKEIVTEKRGKILDLLENLRGFTQIIKTKSFRNASQSERFVSHYTSIPVMKSLTKKGGKFRLNRYTRMNDSKEGKTFFHMIGDNQEKFVEEFYKKGDNISQGISTYIGSFISERRRRTDRRNRIGDEIIGWQLYGREGTGCSLSYKGIQFSRNLPRYSAFNAMLSLETIQPPENQESPPTLLSIFYESKEGIEGDLNKIRVVLEDIINLTKEEVYQKHTPFIKSCTSGLLDEVRFLFKDIDWDHEREVRIVIQVPDSLAPYKDLDKEFHPADVVLGPEARKPDKLACWLEKNAPDINVRQSAAPYQKPKRGWKRWWVLKS